jgi:hypothetical protein
MATLAEIRKQVKVKFPNQKLSGKGITKDFLISLLEEQHQQDNAFSVMTDEAILEILLTLDDVSLNSLCKSEKRIKMVCEKQELWRRKLINETGYYFKATERNFKKAYINLIKYGFRGIDDDWVDLYIFYIDKYFNDNVLANVFLSNAIKESRPKIISEIISLIDKDKFKVDDTTRSILINMISYPNIPSELVIALLDILSKRIHIDYSYYKILATAILHNRLDLVGMLLNPKYNIDVNSTHYDYLEMAILNDNVSMIDLLLVHGAKERVPGSIISIALKKSTNETLKYLIEKDFSLPDIQFILRDIGSGGNIEIFEYLKSILNFSIEDQTEILNWAVISDHLELVKYLLSPSSLINPNDTERNILATPILKCDPEMIDILLNPPNGLAADPYRDKIYIEGLQSRCEDIQKKFKKYLV